MEIETKRRKEKKDMIDNKNTNNHKSKWNDKWYKKQKKETNPLIRTRYMHTVTTVTTIIQCYPRVCKSL